MMDDKSDHAPASMINKICELEDKFQDYEYPKVSVIIPAYNCVQTIASTIESVLKQDYLSFELIVIDGGSRDRTLEVVCSYRDPRIHIYSTSNSQHYEMLNKGISYATGQYLNFLFPGDFYLFPGVLKSIMSLVLENESPHLAYCAMLLRDGKSEPKILFRPLTKSLLMKGQLPTSLQSCWFRSNLFVELGKFNAAYKFRGDYEFICRFFMKNQYRIIHTRRVLTDYDFRNISRKMVFDHFRDTLKNIYRHFGLLAAIRWFFLQKDGSRFVKLWMKTLKVAFLGRS